LKGTDVLLIYYSYFHLSLVFCCFTTVSDSAVNKGWQNDGKLIFDTYNIIQIDSLLGRHAW